MLEPKFVPVQGQITAAIMDCLRIPVFLVSHDCELLYSNAAGIAALKEGDSLRRAGSMLASTHPADNARLKTAVAATCSRGERQTVMLNDVRNPKPQIAAILPFVDDDRHPETEALVVVQRCDPSDEAFAQALRQLFRLSAAETAIAAALVSGADVEQIAKSRNAKVTTVRTQIAAMMLKTRARRQGELTALFSRVCALP